MQNFIINGGKQLRGSVSVGHSKNAALAILHAALLTKGTTTLHNVPDIEDIRIVLEVFKKIGVKVKTHPLETGPLKITPPDQYDETLVNGIIGGKIRSVLYLMGSLIHCLDSFSIPQPGGCALGDRTIVAHTDTFKEMGINVSETCEQIRIEKTKSISKDRNVRIVMIEASDTGTCNAILAAVLMPGTTTLVNASFNYMVIDLCVMLKKMGANITITPQEIIIVGVSKLMPVEYFIMHDPIEAFFFIAVGITTKSCIAIHHCPLWYIESEIKILKFMGAHFEISKPYRLENNEDSPIVDIIIKTTDIRGLQKGEKIKARAGGSGINVDNLIMFAPVVASARGTTLIHDDLYEKRIVYLEKMSHFGCELYIDGIHKALITGPTKWHSADVESPEGLRPATNLLICALAAPGKSIIRNTRQINRGYQDIVKKLREIGADISMSDDI